MKIFLFFLMMVSSAAFAEQTPWEKLHAHLLQPENYYQKYNLFLLENIIPDKTVPHQADYFETAQVIVHPDGSLTPIGTKVFTETWTLDADNNWDVDQWRFTATDDGVPTALVHNHIVETQDTIVVKYEQLPDQDPTSPAAAAVWQAALERWFAWDSGPQR